MAKSERQTKAINIVSAIITRVLFIFHGWVAVYMTVYHLKDPFYWVVVIGLVLLSIEMGYTIIVRKAHEYKFFWPSCFLYLCTMIPCVWILEYQLFEDRVHSRDAAYALNTTVACQEASHDHHSSADTIDFSSGTVFPPGWYSEQNSCLADSSSKKSSSINSSELKNIAAELGNSLAALFMFSLNVLTKKWCELSTMFVLIGGRWLLPRGDITRDQLSALLLEFVSIAADILELFDSIEEEAVMYNLNIYISVLLLYSWSMCQFALVTTATAGEEEVQLNKNKVAPDDPLNEYNKQIVNQREKTAVKRKYIQKLEEQQLKKRTSQPQMRGKGRKNNNEVDSPSVSINVVGDAEARKLLVHGDIWGIASSIIMQDGPFLILRVYMLIQYGIDNDLHVFFICKNAISLSLMVYRLCVLTCHGQDDEEDLFNDRDSAWKFRSAQIAVATTQIMATGNIKLDKYNSPTLLKIPETEIAGDAKNGEKKNKGKKKFC